MSPLSPLRYVSQFLIRIQKFYLLLNGPPILMFVYEAAYVFEAGNSDKTTYFTLHKKYTHSNKNFLHLPPINCFISHEKQYSTKGKTDYTISPLNFLLCMFVIREQFCACLICVRSLTLRTVSVSRMVNTFFTLQFRFEFVRVTLSNLSRVKHFSFTQKKRKEDRNVTTTHIFHIISIVLKCYSLYKNSLR